MGAGTVDGINCKCGTDATSSSFASQYLENCFIRWVLLYGTKLIGVLDKAKVYKPLEERERLAADARIELVPLEQV